MPQRELREAKLRNNVYRQRKGEQKYGGNVGGVIIQFTRYDIREMKKQIYVHTYRENENMERMSEMGLLSRFICMTNKFTKDMISER